MANHASAYSVESKLNTSIKRILTTAGNGFDSFAVMSDKLSGGAVVQFEGKDYHLASTFITTAQTAHALKCAVGLRVAGVRRITITPKVKL
jgi:hypothetical protein